MGSSHEILDVAGGQIIKASNAMLRSLVFNLNILRNHWMISKQEGFIVWFVFQ